MSIDTAVPTDNAAIIRACFTAYERKDRALLESLLAPDFTFSSPLDDNISRERYFERCWPNSEHLSTFQIEKLFVEENEAFVQYCARPTGGRAPFRNTEFFTLRNGLVTHVDVYFGSETGTAAAEEEIRSVIESWAEAIRKRDVDGVLRHMGEESVRFYLAPPLRTTTPLRKNLEDWFATWKGDIGYEIRDLQIHMAADLAYAHSLNHVTGTKVNGEPDADLWFRETMGLRQIDGHWRITHEHESVPFKMDGSFQAAIDLKP
ncbi:MAG TPA: nuclear transport factor 2 family protein [Chthoniobacteraceae bacterium]|nr:nuclear transport factor 2 family protein [Chthoniobacteraceae bacterium]